MLVKATPCENWRVFLSHSVEYCGCDGERILRIFLLVLIQYTNVTDSKTDRQTDRHRATA